MASKIINSLLLILPICLQASASPLTTFNISAIASVPDHGCHPAAAGHPLLSEDCEETIRTMLRDIPIQNTDLTHTQSRRGQMGVVVCPYDVFSGTCQLHIDFDPGMTDLRYFRMRTVLQSASSEIMNDCFQNPSHAGGFSKFLRSGIMSIGYNTLSANATDATAPTAVKGVGGAQTSFATS